MRPGTRSTGFGSPRQRAASACVDDDELLDPRAQLVELDRVVGARPRLEGHGSASSSPAVSGPRQRVESITRAAVVAEVAQQPPEPLGAAERAVGDDEGARVDAGRARRRGEASAAGSGWRPPRPGGADRSRSTSTNTAPGMWPARYCARPAPGVVERPAAVGEDGSAFPGGTYRDRSATTAAEAGLPRREARLRHGCRAPREEGLAGEPRRLPRVLAVVCEEELEPGGAGAGRRPPRSSASSRSRW